MNKRTRTSPTLKIAAVLLATYGLPAMAQNDSAQVLFTNDKLTVIDAKGVERVARQGDFLHPGDMVKTAIGVIGQIRLPDGTLISARPDSEIKLDVIDRNKEKNILAITQGNVRVINADLPNRPQPKPMDVRTPASTLNLIKADGEAFHMKPGNKAKIEAGTYTRLQTGTGVMRAPTGDLPLLPQQGSFVPRPEIAPVNMAALPVPLMTPPTLTLISGAKPLTPPTLTLGGGLSPSINTSLLASGVPVINGPLAGSPAANQASGVSTQVGTALIQPAVLATIKPITINTAVILKPPPPPPPPPPPKLIIIKKFP
jgi:hypothetical protein